MPENMPNVLPESSPRLWFAMLAGPVAWSAHLLVSYALVPTACDTGWTFLLIIVTIVTAITSLLGAVVGNRLPHGANGNGNNDVSTVGARLANATERMRFIAYASVMSGYFFAAVIIAQTLPVLFLDPCTWGRG